MDTEKLTSNPPSCQLKQFLDAKPLRGVVTLVQISKLDYVTYWFAHQKLLSASWLRMKAQIRIFF